MACDAFVACINPRFVEELGLLGLGEELAVLVSDEVWIELGKSVDALAFLQILERDSSRFDDAFDVDVGVLVEVSSPKRSATTRVISKSLLASPEE